MKYYILYAVFLLSLAIFADPVVFSRLPQNLQVFPRNRQSNSAAVPVAGSVVSNGYSAIVTTVFRDSIPYTAVTQSLVYSSGSAPFDLSVEIIAELHNYDFQITLLSSGAPLSVASVQDVVAGDIFMCNGQSNSEAGMYTGSSIGNTSHFLRTFGLRSWTGSLVANNKQWHLAEGDSFSFQNTPGVGQWNMRLGRRIIDQYSIPVAILNHAWGGTPIGPFQRNDANPADLNSNYGQLLYRSRLAGVIGSYRAILWYQGENDGDNGAVHEAGFRSLYHDWLQDYPSVEKTYVCQIRVGCGVTRTKVDLRDRQRRLADDPSLNISVMSTTSLNGHNGCHYTYENGYRNLGDYMFNMIARDLYAAPPAANVDPPNISRAFFSNAGRTEITLVMRNSSDALVYEAGAHVDFMLENSAVDVIVGFAVSNTVVLSLSDRCMDATGISYVSHQLSGPRVMNAGGVGLLCFYNIPIEYVSYPEPFIINDFSASNVLSASAILQGYLMSTGQSPTEVSVFYGTVDGGSDSNAWQSTLSIGLQSPGYLAPAVSSLLPGSTYFYRFFARNAAAVAWADVSQQFTTMPPAILSQSPGASNISTNSARLNGTLIFAEVPTAVTVFWGDNDGAADPLAWDNAVSIGAVSTGVFSTTVSSLATGAPYFYRCFGSNSVGTAWSDASTEFYTDATFDQWLYRLKITFSGYSLTDALTNFPALVVFNSSISGFDYSLFDSPNGADLRFFDDAGVELPYEIDTWNTNGDSFVWVRIPVLRNNQTWIKTLIGKDGINPPAYTTDGSVWSEGYAAVWHLSQSNPADSANGWNGNGLGNSDAPGLIGPAQRFTQDVHVVVGDLDLSPSLTIEAWLKDSQAPPVGKYIINKASAFSFAHLNNDGVFMYLTGSNGFQSVGTADITGWSGWHYLAGSWNGSSGIGSICKDGSNVFSYAGSPNPLKLNDRDLLIGQNCNAVMDELRLSRVPRSESWLWASWKSQAAPREFASYSHVWPVPEPTLGLLFTLALIAAIRYR